MAKHVAPDFAAFLVRGKGGDNIPHQFVLTY